MNNRSRLRTWIMRMGAAAFTLAAVMVGLSIYSRASARSLRLRPEEVPSVTRQEPSPPWTEAVSRARRALRSAVAERNLAGLSVAVGAQGRLVWAEGFGYADIDERATVTPETRFSIGTASQALTAAGVGALLENGRLSLDDPIQTHVPQFSSQSAHVTLRQLMANVAGIETDGGDDEGLIRQRCERPDQAIGHFKDKALLFEPGTRYRDSRYGWILVSAAVEAASQQPFLAFMKEHVFAPAGMNDTGADSATKENPGHVGEPEEDAPPVTFFVQLFLHPLGIFGPKPRSMEELQARAVSYAPKSGSDSRSGLYATRPHNVSCYAGSLAFLSTPSDLVRFGLAVGGGRLLSKATVDQLQESQRLTSGQETHHGLGFDLLTVNTGGGPVPVFARDGESRAGKVATLLVFRETGLVVALISNVSTADTSGLAVKVAEAFAPVQAVGATLQ
jgi:serine beta-lactamase-like protein LACTB